MCLLCLFAEQSGNPRLLLVELQVPLTTLARAELTRQEAEILPQNSKLLEEARRELYRATSQLTLVQRKVAEALRIRNRNSGGEAGALSARELLSMLRNISYQRGRAERNVARCFDEGSADRVDALTQAIKHLAPLANARATDLLSWNARIDRAACHRLLGHFEKAQAQLNAITVASPPLGMQARIITEKGRQALAQDAIDRAILVLEKGAIRKPAGSAYQRADLNYARLESYLAAWQRAQRGERQRGKGQRGKGQRASENVANQGDTDCRINRSGVWPLLVATRQDLAGDAHSVLARRQGSYGCWPARPKTICTPANLQRRWQPTTTRGRWPKAKAN